MRDSKGMANANFFRNLSLIVLILIRGGPYCILGSTSCIAKLARHDGVCL